jgi:ribosomal-protein-alanine N-acetyltransferase
MLETTRLLLRPAIIEDAPSLFELNSDPLVMQFTGDSPFANIHEAEKLIRERLQFQQNTFGMSRLTVLLKDGTYLGWCGLKYFPENDEVDIGYRLLRKHWGKGYATEASKAALKHGFETLKLERIIGKAMPANVKSLKVLQKLGMTFRGFYHDPTDPIPLVFYDLRSHEYRP